VAEALELFREAGEDLRAAQALIQLGHLTWIQGENLRGLELLEQGIELAASYPPGAELAFGEVRRAGYLMMSSRPRECLEASQRAIELAEQIGRDEYRFRAVGWRGVARCELGDAGGVDDLREALDAAAGTSVASSFYNNLADFLWELESPEAALEIHAEGEAYAERRGMRGEVMWSRAEMTWMLYDLGRWDEVISIADHVRAFEQAEGASQIGLIAAPIRALVLMWRGDPDGAASVADELLPRARKALDPQVLVPALALRALATGDVGAVAEIEEFTRDRADWHRARFLVELGPLTVSAGRPDLVRSLVDTIDVSIGRTAIAVTSARALIAENDGRTDEALTLHEEAARCWADHGFVLGRARSLQGAGRCLLALERRREAAFQLREARDLFENLGAKPLVAEVDDVLARAASVSA
jgi:tetratricopeptide (TPR) repeat protein